MIFSFGYLFYFTYGSFLGGRMACCGVWRVVAYGVLWRMACCGVWRVVAYRRCYSRKPEYFQSRSRIRDFHNLITVCKCYFDYKKSQLPIENSTITRIQPNFISNCRCFVSLFISLFCFFAQSISYIHHVY